MNGASFFKTGVPTSSAPADPLAAMFRPACSECGSGRIRWAQLVDLLRLVDVDDRPRIHELLGYVGPEADAWHCSDCGGFGAFA